MIRTLESNKEKQLRFLRYFITANYDIESWRSAEIVREDEIYTWFSAQNNLSKWSEDGDYFKFLRKLQRNAETFVEFVNGKTEEMPDKNIDLVSQTNIKTKKNKPDKNKYIAFEQGREDKGGLALCR